MKKDSESAVVESWSRNVAPWIQAVRGEEIQSRTLATNKAIVDVVLDLRPRTVLDIGCGEGWLARELGRAGVDVLGIDAVPAFIEAAENEGIGRYRVLAYQDLSPQAIGETFDVLVCNFSLFGKESVSALCHVAHGLLNEHGAFVVQTLHPSHVQDGDRQKDGWRAGSWAGFNSGFRDPAPWYFRTLESWKRLFAESGFASLELIEPTNPKSGAPASVIFVARSGTR